MPGEEPFDADQSAINASNLEQLDVETRRSPAQRKAPGSGLSPTHSMASSTTRARRKARGRPQSIETIFTSLSKVKSSGIAAPPPRVTLTPRSAECCLRLGINPETLRVRELDSFKEAGIDPAVQRMRHEAYSQRRHDQMKLARAERKRIINSEEHKERSKSPVRSAAVESPLQAERRNTVEMIELEQRRLAKVQHRQQRELEQMLQFEMKMSQVQEEAANKVEHERRREERMERERMKRNRLLQEERRMRELKKRAQAEREEEARRKVAYEMFVKDRELAEQRARKEKRRQIEAKRKEEERARKSEEHRQQTEEILEQQQAVILRRLEDMKKAEMMRMRVMEAQRQEQAKEMIERRQQVEERMDRNAKAARAIEEKRRSDYEERQRQVAIKRERLEEEAEREREYQRKQLMLAERKRQMVLMEARAEEEARKNELIERQRTLDHNVKKIREQRNRELGLRRELQNLNKQLKVENVERIRRIDEYKRLEVMRKLKESEERTKQMVAQKEALILKRKQAAIQTKIRRDNIVAVMDSIRVGGGGKQALQKAASNLNRSLATPSRGKKRKGNRARTSRRANKSESMPQLRSQTAGALGPPPEAPSRQAAREDAQSTMPQAYQSPYDVPLTTGSSKAQQLKKAFGDSSASF